MLTIETVLANTKPHLKFKNLLFPQISLFLCLIYFIFFYEWITQKVNQEDI